MRLAERKVDVMIGRFTDASQRDRRRGLLTRITSELPGRMPDRGLITLQGEPPSPAALAFMDVIRRISDPVAEAASAAGSTPGAGS